MAVSEQLNNLIVTAIKKNISLFVKFIKTKVEMKNKTDFFIMMLKVKQSN